MARTILQLINDVQDELGLSRSTLIYPTASDLTGTQMGALANRVLDELRQMARWTTLQFEYDLVVSIPITTTGSMAAGSAVITAIPSTTGITAKFFTVSGAGIPPAARIISVDSATQVTMSMENTNTAVVTGTDLIFAKDTYPMPSDFDWFNNDTMWDRTNHWRLNGPDSPQVDQWHLSGIVATGPRRNWRKLGPYANQFRLWPAPTEIVAPLQMVFEYISLNAVSVSGGATVPVVPATYAQYFQNDDDICLLNEQAIIMGIKWMFWEIKGFGSYITLQNRWIDYVNRLAGRDGGASILSLARRTESNLISPANIPDGNWPSQP